MEYQNLNSGENYKQSFALFIRKAFALGITAVVVFFMALSFFNTQPKKKASRVLSDAALRVQMMDLKGQAFDLTNIDTAKAQLGSEFFKDSRFSDTGKTSCLTCHIPELYFTDGKPQAQAALKPTLTRNTPPLFNLSVANWFFWDGSADSLAAQALGPIEHPHEHGFSQTEVAAVIAHHYKSSYEQVFGSLPRWLLDRKAPSAATPAREYPMPSVEISAYALASLGDLSNLNWALNKAAELRVAPVRLMEKIISEREQHYYKKARKEPEVPSPNLEIESELQPPWEALTQKQKKDIETVAWNFARALEHFQLGLTSDKSPFDKFLDTFLKTGSKERSLNDGFGEIEYEGLKIFAGKGNCMACHHGPNFTDQQFHNTGLAYFNDVDARRLPIGRAWGAIVAANSRDNCRAIKASATTRDEEACKEMQYFDFANLEQLGAFKTPTLRNIEKTGPYMHDGRFESLEEVIDHYIDANSQPAIGHREETLVPLDLNNRDKESLIAFLKSLTGNLVDHSSAITISAAPSKNKKN